MRARVTTARLISAQITSVPEAEYGLPTWLGDAICKDDVRTFHRLAPEVVAAAEKSPVTRQRVEEELQVAHLFQCRACSRAEGRVPVLVCLFCGEKMSGRLRRHGPPSRPCPGGKMRVIVAPCANCGEEFRSQSGVLCPACLAESL